MLEVRVDGVNELRLKFAKFKVKSSDLSDAWKRIGDAIADDARVLVPTLTGTLLRSIRAGKAKSRAVVRAGNNRMEPYAGVIHYGGYNNIEPHPFLTTALAQNEGRARQEVEDELDQLIRRLDL